MSEPQVVARGADGADDEVTALSDALLGIVRVCVWTDNLASVQGKLIVKQRMRAQGVPFEEALTASFGVRHGRVLAYPDVKGDRQWYIWAPDDAAMAAIKREVRERWSGNVPKGLPWMLPHTDSP